MKQYSLRWVSPLLAAAAFVAWMAPASALGTAIIQQRSGTTKTYTGVRIAIRDESMAITSDDGQGMLVVGKAACTKVGDLVKCLPYDATLFQYGQKFHIPLQSGTVWLNPTQEAQPLSGTSQKLQPRGVMMVVKTRRGTLVSLTGRVDEVIK